MRLIHRPPANAERRGFTLVELLVVISIFVVLTVMTIGAINLSSTSARVRGAARQVQSKVEGARDRAIYNSRENPGNPRPVGIRLLVNDSITEDSPSGQRRAICTSLVYIESPANDSSGVIEAFLDVGGQPALRATNTNWATLNERGLIGPGTKIKVEGWEQPLTMLPDAFPLSGPGPHIVHTFERHPDMRDSGNFSLPLTFSVILNPDVMTGEEALELPRGTCIDLETSHLPDGWMAFDTTGNPQFSNRMDILFSAKGTVVGDAAAAGIIHLHIVDLADALENALPGSPTVPRDTNGDGTDEYPVAQFPVPPDRHGDELGITIFTKAGRVISHPIRSLTAYPAPWQSGQSYAVGDTVSPNYYNGLVFQAVIAGMSNNMGEPPWSLTPGGRTVDGGVSWLSSKHDVWEFGLQGEVAK